MREHGLARNPASAELVDRPSVRYSGEFVTFDGEELAALARHAANLQDATLFLMAAFTGLRQGELLALRWRRLAFLAEDICSAPSPTDPLLDGAAATPRGRSCGHRAGGCAARSWS
ncbi:MAG: hypothetical protein M3N47_09775, partial [Chloroflexota bacterium]|nr:hypothetical protein [Chloroflexota bacterium]